MKTLEPIILFTRGTHTGEETHESVYTPPGNNQTRAKCVRSPSARRRLCKSTRANRPGDGVQDHVENSGGEAVQRGADERGAAVGPVGDSQGHAALQGGAREEGEDVDGGMRAEGGDCLRRVCSVVGWGCVNDTGV